jgi:uncharacterized membrane protein YdjX (TVP38/TMEM64 family)
MEIKILFISWFSLGLIGLVLMNFRSDVDKFRSEAQFIMSKGTFFHKVTYVLIAIVLLPFTIPYSIQEMLKK